MKATISIGLGLALMMSALIAAPATGCSSPQCVGSASNAFGCDGVDGGSVDGGWIFPDVAVDAAPPFNVNPSSEQVITVTCGQTTPTVAFTATNGTTPLSVAWSTDQASIGTVSPASGTSTTFVPTGKAGGIVHVIGTYNGASVATPIFVKLTCTESTSGCPATQIATTTAQLTQGGGVGGVGGEGCGAVETDTATNSALANPSSDGSTQGLKFLYPYANTVFPRGMLAPSLQWDWSIGDADAIRIDLETASDSFKWFGTFTRPAILAQTNGKFIRHPIPEDVWEMATNTAGTSIHGKRDDLTIKITLARGGVGYGALAETVTIAPGRMKGTIYYQTYGTSYVTSSWGMGAGVMAIKHGATAPVLVTSHNHHASPNDDQRCQGCHSVAAKGSTLLLEDSPSGGYDWSYDLTQMQPNAGALQSNGAPPTSDAVPDNGIATMPAPVDQYTWGAINPDGTLLFSNAGAKWGMPNYGFEGSVQTPSVLFSLPSGNSLVGAAQIQTQLSVANQLYATMPVFSPDGKHIAFNFWKGGPGSDGKSGDQISLAVVDFDPNTHAFSNLHTIDTPTQSTSCPNCSDVWPSYVPTSDALVFHRQIVADNYEEGGDSCNPHYGVGSYGPATEGARGELWWVDVASKMAHRLDALDGAGYLPTGALEHQDDTTLQYQPTVAPIASGGYAWIVFTSRRLYGNTATLNPWDSNTQGTGGWKTQPMTKKLWVAAIDLNAPPGTDPSHPGFYLPAQELMAGNMRGFWVLDPCEQNGTSCESGDECCSGHCDTGGDGGAQTCGNPTTCGGEGDTCSNDADAGVPCCPGLQCYGGTCDVIPVK